MNISIYDLINELQTPENIFVPKIIEEINTFVSHKLFNINVKFVNNSNKFFLLANLANLGLELENNFNRRDNTILSTQLGFIDKLINPIINKIRNICLDLNMELVEEYKNLIYRQIELEPIKYAEQKKNIKYLQINCFCRNTNYVVGKEILFEDFGITIKITNCHFKDIFKNLFTNTNIFIQNNNTKDKRFDWYWKAIEYNNNLDDKYTHTLGDENLLIIKNIETNEPTDENNLDNETIESFKIIQKNQDLIKPTQSTNMVSEINILKPSDKEMSKIISNSIIIEDESFTIPIDNINDNLSTITNNFQES